MRVTFNMLPLKYMANLSNSLNKLVDANERVTKGRNLLNPEDNPVAYVSAINIQRTIDEADQFKVNAENSLTWLQNTDSELQRGVALLSQAKNQYAIAGANDSQDATSRKALAGDVKNILDSMIDIGNANYMGRYIFGGFETETAPFAAGSREISSVSTDNPEIDVYTKKVFGDMPEAKEGEYTVRLFKDPLTNYVTIQVFDKNDNIVFIDSNGSDETAKGGNKTATSITTYFKPNEVVNTGIGFGIKLPEKDFVNSEIKFYYKPGDDIKYHGDDGEINVKIGYNQEVTQNITGKELFLEANRVLKSTRYNTIKGIDITSTTLFSQIDGANVGKGDYIDISGTDHYGFKVGTAKAQSVKNVTLDMTDKSETERSILIKYANKDYLVTLDQRAYTDIDDVVFSLNRTLESQGLGNEIEAIADGDRIILSSIRSGDMVNFQVFGSTNNTLGFEGNLQVSNTINFSGSANVSILDTNLNPIEVNFSSTDEEDIKAALYNGFGDNYALINPTYTPTDASFKVVTYAPYQNITAKGKDTRFEFGYDNFDTKNKVSVSFSAVSTNSASDTTFYINGQEISFRATDENSNGKIDIFEIEKALDNSLKDAGLNFNVTYNITPISVSANTTYEIEFALENVNYGSDTYLSVVYNSQSKYDNPYSDDFPTYNEKRVGDLLSFIENLYDYTVKAEVHNGNIYVTDERGGKSKFSLQLNESNTGLGYPEVSRGVNVIGAYTGNSDDIWRVNVVNNAGVLDISVVNLDGDTIFTNSISNYSGEPIDIGHGVFIALDSNMNQSFRLELKANSSLSFGDMNIVSDGKNVDTFRSLKNLYDALNLDIPEEGIKAPSAWKDETFTNKAVPYLDGTFRGNYNDEWTYEILASKDKTSYYIQQELSTSSLNETDLPQATDFSFDVIVSDNKGETEKYTVEVPANSSVDNVVDIINSDPNLIKAGIRAQMVENKLIFSSGSGLKEIAINANSATAATALGIYNLDTGSSLEKHVISNGVPQLDLSDTTDAERTITFKYFDGNDWNVESVVVEPRVYGSTAELAESINNKIGVDIVAKEIEGRLAFQYDTDNSGDIYNLLVEGDYAGTLGYYKSGDEVKVKVSGSSGEVINFISLDTANKLTDVADGVKLAFNSGNLYISDSFTSAVGSGIKYEIPVLDAAETQLTTHLTLTGTRQNRVESVINFHTTISTSNEQIKAQHLGATEVDMMQAITDFMLAQQAYQMAMTASARILQMSIMDYLR